MFKLAAERLFKAKINIQLPNENGTHSQLDFLATFKLLKVSEIEVFKDEPQNTELLKKVFVGFEKVLNEDGSEALFSPETRDALIDEPLVRNALSRVYLAEAVQGTGKQKN